MTTYLRGNQPMTTTEEAAAAGQNGGE
jgi:hypothetical protein